jgi:hypothetical protein
LMTGAPQDDTSAVLTPDRWENYMISIRIVIASVFAAAAITGGAVAAEHQAHAQVPARHALALPSKCCEDDSVTTVTG